jgi:hypothetical protein
MVVQPVGFHRMKRLERMDCGLIPRPLCVRTTFRRPFRRILSVGWLSSGVCNLLPTHMGYGLR